MINISCFGIFPLLLRMGQGISVTHTVRVTYIQRDGTWASLGLCRSITRQNPTHLSQQQKAPNNPTNCPTYIPKHHLIRHGARNSFTELRRKRTRQLITPESEPYANDQQSQPNNFQPCIRFLRHSPLHSRALGVASTHSTKNAQHQPQRSTLTKKNQIGIRNFLQ